MFWVQPPALGGAAASVTWVTVSCGGVGVGLGVGLGLGVGEGATQMRPKATAGLVAALGFLVAAVAVESSRQGSKVKKTLICFCTLPPPGATVAPKVAVFTSEGVPGTAALAVTAPAMVEPD